MEKIKSDNFKISGRVQHIFDYISVLEDRIEDNDRQYKTHLRSISTNHQNMHLKESQAAHGRSLLVSDLSPRRYESTRQFSPRRGDYTLHPAILHTQSVGSIQSGYQTQRDTISNERLFNMI